MWRSHVESQKSCEEVMLEEPFRDESFIVTTALSVFWEDTGVALCITLDS